MGDVVSCNAKFEVVFSSFFLFFLNVFSAPIVLRLESFYG